jgi:hypothetical protein
MVRRPPGHPADRLDADEQLIALFGHRQHPEPAQSQQRVVEFGTVTHGGGLPLSKPWTATRMAGPLAAPVDTYPSAVSCSRAPVLYEEGSFVKGGGRCSFLYRLLDRED